MTDQYGNIPPTASQVEMLVRANFGDATYVNNYFRKSGTSQLSDTTVWDDMGEHGSKVSVRTTFSADKFTFEYRYDGYQSGIVCAVGYTDRF